MSYPNINTEMQSFYPRPFRNWGTMESTESIVVASGLLTVGNVYFISKSGNNSNFPGSITNEYGDIFTATNTGAVFDGAILIDVTNGNPTKIGYFYGNPQTLQFVWNLGYNADGKCIFTTVSDANGKQIDF